MKRSLTPDFNKRVVEILAKRAGNWCSNPECRTLTSGPSEAPDKAINIGEAAHIYGAKEGSARHRDDMTDVSRSDITNGIWLCRNCHKLADSDPIRFSAELLFEWRIIHENYVITKVGSPTDRIRLDLATKEAAPFADDSPRARQIVHDRPDFWEYSLTAELLREYLKQPLRAWSDLQRGLYLRDILRVDETDFFAWFTVKADEAVRLVGALAELYSEELYKAWGMPGEPGDPLEIRHVCKLIQDAAERSVRWEEEVQFISAPEVFDRLLPCLPGPLGGQLVELSRIPVVLEEGVAWSAENPGCTRKIGHTIEFTLPDGWTDRVSAELRRVNRLLDLD